MSNLPSVPTTSAPPRRNRPPLAAAVVQNLAMAIVTKEYPSGTALPPAGTLCEMFEVSRTVIREATTALAEKGLVSTRQGWGTVVLDQSHWNLLDPLILDGLFRRHDRLRFLDNLIQIRINLECPMASSAADRLTEEDTARLTEHLESMAGLLDDAEAYAAADIAFHNIIHQISQDAFGRAIVANIQSKALNSAQYSGNPKRADLDATHAAHIRIHEAILAGDAEAAAAAMRNHITQSWSRRRPRGE
ncbi:FadR/GntR family transcriptional regulator [Streptomyces brasiliensis]|uniref:FadR/GntR family transcriptional regulator n=1 Tax=Streptomyces brasiliensis TaxID=1954 RepID=UPI00167087A4|nr:FCD domain-containing protein [Streptomyces brasiliensis]